jgi:hypothetical protein
MAPIGYSEPWGKLIFGKKQKLKISCQTPVNNLLFLKSNVNVLAASNKGKN